MEGDFQWALLDSQFAAADRYGKRVTLAVLNGPACPGWLFAQGAEPFPYLFRGSPNTLAVPWDSVFIAKWGATVAAVGARYRNQASLALVHATHSTGNGFEMQLPSTPTDVSNWQARGYSHARVIDSWARVLDAFADAFPTTSVDVDVHPVVGSDSVANGVIAEGSRRMGDRFGVFAAWWSQNNTSVYPGSYQLLQTGVDSSFGAVQMVASGSSDSARFGPGGMPAALDLAASQGVRYWEVWNSDILDPDFESLLRTYNTSATVDVLPTRPLRELGVSMAPNPTREEVLVRLTLEHASTVAVRVIDVAGREVASAVQFHGQPGPLVLRIWLRDEPPGLYFVNVIRDDRSATHRIVRLR